MGNKRLQKLYKQVDDCKFCRGDKNLLQHIHGFGVLNPKLMLILVNPTYRNLSSDPKYKGVRFPFIGVRQFWRVLAEGGLIDKDIAYKLPLRKDWAERHTEQIKKELIRNKLFLTNVVKCCYGNSAYPDGRVVKEQLKVLAEEIKIVNPKKIVAFGGFVYKILTGKSIKFLEYLRNSRAEKNAEIISGLNVATEPCYFPIGRGNPKKAAEIMKKISQSNFKTYHNHRSEPYFTFLKNGKKTIEGRIKKGWYCFVKPGDHIIVYNKEENDSVEVLVKGVRTYASIREMLEREPLKHLLPDVKTVNEGIAVYKRYYTDKQQEKFGVVAIEVERIKAGKFLRQV